MDAGGSGVGVFVDIEDLAEIKLERRTFRKGVFRAGAPSSRLVLGSVEVQDFGYIGELFQKGIGGKGDVRFGGHSPK